MTTRATGTLDTPATTEPGSVRGEQTVSELAGWRGAAVPDGCFLLLCAAVLRTPNIDALARSAHSAVFSRFYAAAGVCSPTRAALLSGRTNERDCIFSALPCDSEDPAAGCAMGSDLLGSFPTSEFTTAKAAKKSTLGNYATILLGKWHLGDLWDKRLPGMSHKWRVSSPGTAGFDDWLATQAEASSSMSNCGCFPVNHTDPGPPPSAGYKNHSGCGRLGSKPCAGIIPHGDHCVVGGGVVSNWCYKCTDYYGPNVSDPRGVTPLQELGIKEPGDDSEFLVDRFEAFLNSTLAQRRPFYAHLCLHSIHEPHPAMPRYYSLYRRDPDYLGTLTQVRLCHSMCLFGLATYNLHR